MLQFSSNACHIFPLIIRSKKVNHMISVRCCVIEIKDKIRKGHWPFVQGFKMVWFWWKWAQINQIATWTQKIYSLSHITCWEMSQTRGQRLVPTQVYECQMGLTFELSFPLFPNTFAWQTIYFLNLCGNPINLSLFPLKSDHLENLTPVQKVNDLFLFCPLSR